MLTAITRAVSPALVNCELLFVPRQSIDPGKAQAQHRAYEALLGKLGARVISLPAEPALPDSMFVEDPAIVLDELAVIMPLGTESRRPEAASLAQALARFRKLECVTLPGTMEGGDILRIGRKLFAGYDWIDVAPEEPHAANTLALCATVVFPASFPRTRIRLESRGFHVTPLDISELQKAESGLTCSSLLFDAPFV
jgi:N-dimethylarginine dimethylaminohydrolase